MLSDEYSIDIGYWYLYFPLSGILGQDHMCPFGMTGVPARREYFGRLEEAVSKPKQAPSLDLDHG